MAHRSRDIHGVRRPLVELDAARRLRRRRHDRHGTAAPREIPPAPRARTSMRMAMALAVIAVLYLSWRMLTGRRWIA